MFFFNLHAICHTKFLSSQSLSTVNNMKLFGIKMPNKNIWTCAIRHGMPLWFKGWSRKPQDTYQWNLHVDILIKMEVLQQCQFLFTQTLKSAFITLFALKKTSMVFSNFIQVTLPSKKWNENAWHWIVGKLLYLYHFLHFQALVLVQVQGLVVVWI